MQSTGIIIGKFMPPHRGHEYLVRFASEFVDELWIFVCTLPNEPIPGHLRFHWMKELFPKAKHVHIHEVNPEANREKEGAHRIWANTVLKYLPKNPNFVFASENYGWNFAQELGANFIPVDPSRDQFPISGTELRNHPFRYWHFFPSVVRPFFVREIMLDFSEMVPEDAYHSAIEYLKTIALLFNTLYVPSYADFFTDFSQNGHHTLTKEHMIDAQTSLLKALRTQARCFLFRSTVELRNDFPLIGKPDLWIQIKAENSFLGSTKNQNWINNAMKALESAAIPQITMVHQNGSIAHEIRDLVIDQYKNWL